MIQEEMGAKGVILVMSIIILLYPLAEAVDSDKDQQQLHLDDRIDWDETMDEDTAELLWVKCGAELGVSMEDFQDLQYCESDKTLVGKVRILKAIIVQDPHVKKTLLDCLRDKRIVLSKSRKDKLTRKWYLEYLVSYLHKPDHASRRRRLADSVSQGTVIVAVIVTAIVTLCVAGFLFYCYIRNFGLAGIQNDERPLLSLRTGKKSTSGDSKKSVNSKGKNGSAENQSNGQRDATVDSGLHMKVSVDPTMNPPVGRVKSSLKHTLKPRAVRAESSLRPTGKIESSIRPSGGKTESPVGGTGTESSPRQPPVNVHSPVSSPATAAATLSPATAPSTFSPAAAPSTPPTTPGPPSDLPPPQGATPPAPPPLPTGGEPPPSPPTGGGGAPPPPPPKPGESTSGPPPPPRRQGASIRPPRRAGADPADASKAKLKPFFWDKVMAKPDQQMVWDKIKSGSFQFNEEMIESLFGYHAPGKDKDQNTKNTPAKEPQTHFVQIIDPKKAQNLSILLKALNVTTEEVSTALIEGNELPIEIVQTLLKMAPTSEEELKLRLYGGDLSRLGPAERFLKALVEIPYAFRRLESLLFMCTLQDEEANIKESFETLEAACVELKKSQLFHKLLEAVLKTGNRMNVGTFRGSAKAFKLDTLLKLSDVKGLDGKTTLLHFVVQEIMRGEGIRAVRAAKDSNKRISTIETKDLEASDEATDEHYCRIGLEVVSRLSSELENVAKAAIIDADGLTSSVSKLSIGLEKARESLNTDMKNLELQSEDEEGDEFWLILSGFVETAEKEISWMLEQEKRIMALVKTTADYFHGNCGKDEGLRLFSVVSDFLIILEKVCKEIQAAPIKPPKKKDDQTQKPDDLQLCMVEDYQDKHKTGDPTQPLPPILTQTPKKKDEPPPKSNDLQPGMREDDQDQATTVDPTQPLPSILTQTPKMKDDPTQKPNNLQPGIGEDDHDQATTVDPTQPLPSILIQSPKKKDDPTQKPDNLQPGMGKDDQDQATTVDQTQPLPSILTQTPNMKDDPTQKTDDLQSGMGEVDQDQATSGNQMQSLPSTGTQTPKMKDDTTQKTDDLQPCMGEYDQDQATTGDQTQPLPSITTQTQKIKEDTTQKPDNLLLGMGEDDQDQATTVDPTQLLPSIPTQTPKKKADLTPKPDDLQPSMEEDDQDQATTGDPTQPLPPMPTQTPKEER